MLEIEFDEIEYFDDSDEDIRKHHFVVLPPITIQLEHSLVSVSKWEMKWHKPYLGDEPKTESEAMDYIKCMALNKVDDDYFKFLTYDDIKRINEYINNPMTATWFSNKEKKFGKKEIITSEIIYYWLVALQIPFEVQYWHLNRLFTLVQVVNEKNAPAKKRSKSDLLREQYRQNEARLAKYKTHG